MFGEASLKPTGLKNSFEKMARLGKSTSLGCFVNESKGLEKPIGSPNSGSLAARE